MADTFLVSGNSFHAFRFPAVSRVEMKVYERSLQAPPFFPWPAHLRGLSHAALAWLLTTAPNGELALRLCFCTIFLIFYVIYVLLFLLSLLITITFIICIVPFVKNIQKHITIVIKTKFYKSFYQNHKKYVH